MTFNGKPILINGATGNVGSSTVKEFLEQASLDKLMARLQENSVPTKKLILIAVDISNDQELSKVMNQIREKLCLKLTTNFIPFFLNKPGSSYTLVTGASDLVDEIGPEKIPSDITGISQTTLYGISKVARYETKNHAVKFNELLIDYLIEDDDTYKKLVSEEKVLINLLLSIFPKIAKK
ncbi:hypothetical protein RhiirA4_454875 [Rhizophagus irregularis]|uniref:Uncharacterized protein n=1 Tax=Rhizophagus irregularis TaxID=588596 RepID=A0A2I1G3V6_9GLOM|nr:hypothetical protein RhiirA4_454875 [Rhizophagus irregularis]